MILRRVMEHVKAQNWFAVAIDFVIVVSGVFIGMQVANWNEAWTADRRLDQQLAAFTLELEGNLQRIAVYREFAHEQVAAINELRTAFAGDPKTADEGRVDGLLFMTIKIRDLRPELAAYEELAASGGLRGIADAALRREIAQWESDLVLVQRLDRDALAHRDDIVLPIFVSGFSFAAAIERDSQQVSNGFARSRFRNEASALAQSREVENLLALRFALETQILDYSARLEKSTTTLIAALKEREQ